MNKGLVSVVIPCFNDAEFIEQSINSALGQTNVSIEIIVVDDGSDNETKVVLKKLELKINQLITQENKGQSTARNVGIAQSKGEYVLVLDSDDYFEPSFCEKAIRKLQEDAEIKLVSSYVNRLLLDNKTEIFKPIGGDITTFLRYNGATGSCMFRKKDWQTVGGYDEDMRLGFEDWEFYLRLVKNGGYAYIIPELLFNYRIKEVSTTSKANKIRSSLLQYIYYKHSDLYSSNYELLVNHLLARLDREEFEKIKNTQRLEFKIGKAILRPLRYLKSLFK